MRRTLLITFLTVFLAVVITPAGKALPANQDWHFKRASARFFGPNFDWRWFRAQAMAESSMNANAVSPVGAKGLMQLMPATSKEVAEALGIEDNPFNPKTAIVLGVAYDARLWSIWRDPRPPLERLRLTLASYNAGAGNIIRAQMLAKKAGDCTQAWACLVPHLPFVTGKHAAETIGYVNRIERYYRALLVRAKR